MESGKLNLNKDFRRVYGRGKSFVHPGLVTYVLPNRLGAVRYGITTGKKVGCAVMRNRARRVIEAAFRGCLPYISCDGVDVVFVARSKTPFFKSTEIQSAMYKHLKDSGIILGEEQ